MDEKRAMEIFMEQRKKWARNMGLLIQGRKITIGDVETGNQLEVSLWFREDEKEDGIEDNDRGNQKDSFKE